MRFLYVISQHVAGTNHATGYVWRDPGWYCDGFYMCRKFSFIALQVFMYGYPSLLNISYR